jgi:hypothetical protein
MRIELLLIGEELLTGELDPYPSKMLCAVRGRGASIARMTVVPDIVRDIVLELDVLAQEQRTWSWSPAGLDPPSTTSPGTLWQRSSARSW